MPLYVDASVATGVQLPTRIDGDASTSIAGGDEHPPVSLYRTLARTVMPLTALNSRRSITVNAGRACLSVRTSTRSPPRTGAAGLTCRGRAERVQTHGEGMVIVYKSNGRGVIQRVDAKLLSGEETNTFTLPWLVR